MNSSQHIQTLYRQMTSYAQWKDNLAAQLKKYQQWFSDHRLSSAEAQYSLHYALNLLERDSITLAVVGGPSRGKSELVNALLFDHYGQRPLASAAGYPVRCTTEIHCDPGQPCHLRLLPVATRRQTTGVEHFKQIPQEWTTFTFDAKDPVQLRAAMARIGQVKSVSRTEARLLGFNCDTLRSCANAPEKVEIPTWRHALINLEHPLLRQGLRLILVPGIDVLNNEPELTLNTLARVQSLLFLVSADTGVGPEDLTLWKGHIQRLSEHQCTHVLALVNKIDRLLEEADSEYEMELDIHATRETVARQLALPMEQVLALSAKQGLLAKAAQNQAHLQGSHLLHLEMALAQRVMDHQRRITGDRTLIDVIAMLAGTREALKQRLFDCDAQREHLECCPSQQALEVALQTMRTDIKLAHGRCHKRSLALRSSQRRLGSLLPAITASVTSDVLRHRYTALKEQLAQNGSHLGLLQAISIFFRQLSQDFELLTQATSEANQLLTAIYRRSALPVETEDREAFIDRNLFDLGPYQQRLMRLKHQADQFQPAAHTPELQNHVQIKRLVQTLGQEVRHLFEDIQRDIGHWHTQALALTNQNTQCERQLLERHLLLLANLHNSCHRLQSPLHEFRAEISALETALCDLNNIFHHLQPASASATPAAGNVLRLRSEVGRLTSDAGR